MDGVLYFARGKKYNAPGDFPDCLTEAVRSAETLKRVSPDVKVGIFTDDPVPEGLFDICLPLVEGLEPSPFSRAVSLCHFNALCGAKLRCITKSPFEKTLYVDSDTYFLKPVQSVFDQEEDFGIAPHFPTPDFPNAGVMFINGERGKDYIKLWFEAWLLKQGAADDQGVMPEYTSGLSVWDMPWHIWNVRPKNADPGGMQEELKEETVILHTRWHTPDQFYSHG